MEEPRLNAEDQARVDAFLQAGINSVERKPFRVWKLMVLLLVATTTLTLLSIFIQRLYIP